MEIHRNLKDIKLKKSVISIGTFDGMHCGHLKLIKHLNEIAKKYCLTSVLLTFFPHPRIVLKEDKNLKFLSDLEEKIFLIKKKTKIEHLFIIEFTKEIYEMSALDFIKKILLKKLNLKYLILGPDHHFGKNREGSFENLLKFSKKLDFQMEKISYFQKNNIKISSSKIRNLLLNGDIKTSNFYLNYDYFFSGKVIKGKQIGRKIGFPTANISLENENKLIPKNGIYGVKVFYKNQFYDGMLNIGHRPTLKEKNKIKTIEVNIFNFEKNIYNEKLTIFFKNWIREEKNFSSLEELKRQLFSDKKQILNISK